MAKPAARPTQVEDLVRPALVVCSLGAAAIHLATAGEHDALFGAAFLLMAAFQGAWAGAIILTRAPLVLLAGVAGHGAIVATWLAAHTNGLPFGPGAGQPEATGFKDMTATVLELIAIGGALLLLRPDAARRVRERPLRTGGALLALSAALFLTGAAVLSPHAHGPHAHGPGVEAHGHGEDGGHDEGGTHADGSHGHDEDADHEEEAGHAEDTEHGHDLAFEDGTHSPSHDHGDGTGGHDDVGTGDDGHDEAPGDGGAPSQNGEESRVVAGPFAESAGYATPSVTIETGGRVSLTNFDSVLHDVVHDAEADGFGGPENMPWCDQGHHSEGPCPVFWSPLIDAGQTTGVWGLRNVQPGVTYSFFCTLHHGMTGSLTVSQSPEHRGRAV